MIGVVIDAEPCAVGMVLRIETTDGQTFEVTVAMEDLILEAGAFGPLDTGLPPLIGRPVLLEDDRIVLLPD